MQLGWPLHAWLLLASQLLHLQDRLQAYLGRLLEDWSGLQDHLQGESGYSGYFKVKNHLEIHAAQSQDSALNRHSLEVHEGRILGLEDFTMKVVNDHR